MSKDDIEDLMSSFVPVDDPEIAAPDLAYVLDAEDLGVSEWCLVMAPILLVYEENDMREGLCSGETQEESDERWRSVRAWMRERGGALKALSESPVIAYALPESDHLEPVDGWHRSVIAWRDYGLREIPTLIGRRRPDPSLSPDA